MKLIYLVALLLSFGKDNNHSILNDFSCCLNLGCLDYVLSNPLSNLNPFIVGGVPGKILNNLKIKLITIICFSADISDYPHHLAMLLNGFYICGASIISRNFALSAAHCLDRGDNPTAVS